MGNTALSQRGATAAGRSPEGINGECDENSRAKKLIFLIFLKTINIGNSYDIPEV
jgi:hypothetical protein